LGPGRSFSLSCLVLAPLAFLLITPLAHSLDVQELHIFLAQNVNFADNTVELLQIIFFSSSSGFCLRVLIFRLIVSFGTLLKSNCLVDSSSVLLSFSQQKTTVFQIIFLVSSELERDYT
jgi:hypothetical protein